MEISSFSSTNLSMEETYIGLTQNFSNRLTVHEMICSRPHKHYGLLYPYILEQGGMSNILFHVNFTLPTYQYLWLNSGNKMDDELHYILQAFSEFKIGLYEQALFNYYKPNSTHTTQFNFINWVEGYSKAKATDSFDFNLFVFSN